MGMIGPGVVEVEQMHRIARPAMPTMLRRQLVAGGLAFVVLTAGVFWWLFDRVPEGHAPALADLRWGYLPLLLLLLPVETVTAATRIWLILRVLHPGVSFGTCVRSELANVAISTLTPSQSGGGPGQIYILNRDGGVSVGTGLTATLLSFMGTMVGLLLMGVYALLAGGGTHGRLFLAPVWTLTAITGLLLLGATCPAAIRLALGAGSRAVCRALRRPDVLRDWWPPHDPRAGAAVDRMDSTTAAVVNLLYTYREDVRRFLRHGKACVGAVCLLSLAFLLARALMPYLCARFLGVEDGTLRQILESQVALIFLVFFAPTPGGAGVAEGASLWIMADIVPPGVAPYYNLLWRASTVYLAALAGLLCLGFALAGDARRRALGTGGPCAGASRG
jgi:glycosyltransferase 2 family protein